MIGMDQLKADEREKEKLKRLEEPTLGMYELPWEGNVPPLCIKL